MDKLKSNFILLIPIVCLISSCVSFGALPESPLDQAAAKGDLKYINDYQGDINVTDKNGMTPLMWAAQSNQLAVVNALIEYGANVNASDKMGETALTHLCESFYTSPEVVKVLLDAGANVNAKNSDGNTAYRIFEGLHHDSGKPEIVKVINYLVAAGAQ
jgi:ankyrin repeat protein